MTTSSPGPKPSIWASDTARHNMRRRIENFWNRDYLEKIILPLLEIPGGGLVLDVGCGYGGLGLLLAQALPTAHITGVDAEPKMIAGATELATEMDLVNTRFQTGDAYHLPFDGDTFDAVVCQTLLTHVVEPEAVIGDMARVLKPGGVIMTVEYDNTGVRSVHNSANPDRDDGWRLERYRQNLVYQAGKKVQGRGDESIGVHVPRLMLNAGLRVIDVRMNDRVWHAFPPYAKPLEQQVLDDQRHWTDNPPDDTRRALWADTLIAGGASSADVERYFEMTQDPAGRAALREALDSGSWTYVSTPSHLYIIIGRK